VRVEERGQTESETVKGAAYGRFSRRLRAFVIDWIIIALTGVAALYVAVAAESDNVGRIVGIVFENALPVYPVIGEAKRIEPNWSLLLIWTGY
jgi:hypothetical protein